MTAARSTALLLALSFLLLPACRSKENEKAKAPAFQKLNADEYRGEITTIDRLVFSPDFDERSRMMLVGNLAALAGRLDVPSRPAALRQQLQEMRGFAAGLSERRLENPTARQREWMRLRDSLFVTRDWFADSSAEASAWVPPGAPGAVPATSSSSPAAAPPRFELPGRWSVAEVEANGTPDPQSSELGAVWSFDHDGLAIDRGSVAGNYEMVEYIDSSGTALHLDSADGSGGGWLLYRFTRDGRLEVAFYDRFEERPDGFEDPGVVVETGGGDTTTTSTPAASANDTANTADGATSGAAPSAPPAGKTARVSPGAEGLVFYKLLLDPIQ